MKLRRWLVTASLLTAASVGWAAHVRAQLAQHLWFLGDELAALSTAQAAESSLSVNGATLHVVTLTLDLPIHEVLDRFGALCSREAPALSHALQLGAAGSLMRQETSAGGIAVCLAQASDAPLTSLLERARAFARSHDLSAFGQLRYVRAQRTAYGTTHVVFVYNQGRLPLAAMFPGDADAAGGDFAELPRPQAARRLLSAQLSNTGHGLLAYAVPAQPEAALAAYAGLLERNGFVQLQVAPASTDTRMFARGEQLYVVHGQRHGQHSVLSAVRLGGSAMHQPLTAAGTALAEEPRQRD